MRWDSAKRAPYVRGHFNSSAEVYIAATYLLESEDEVKEVADAVGGPVIIGEAPGPNTRGDCPLMPYPKGSTGHNLMEISGMGPKAYLKAFERVDLFERYDKKWYPIAARQNAVQLLLKYPCRPLILLGNKVRDAFKVEGLMKPILHGTNWISCVPHPSGRNQIYRSEDVREEVRKIMWQMVYLWHPPLDQLDERPTCPHCNRQGIGASRWRGAGCGLCPWHSRCFLGQPG